MPVTISIRIKFSENVAIGPGKIRLLELIDETGSISAAGRAMEMSYRRAWLLADDLNSSFRLPVITKQTGGSKGGGAALTEWGREVIARYREMENILLQHAKAPLSALDAAAVVGFETRDPYALKNGD